MAERIFSKLASPGLRKQKEKEPGAPSGATLHHPGKAREHGLEEEEVKEAPVGLGVEESTGVRAGGAGKGVGGLGVEESSGWTGAEKLAKDIPHKTTVGPKMETVGHPRTQEKAPAAPTATTAAKPPAPSTGTGKGREVEEEGEEEMFMPQTPSTTPAMAVAAAADTAQGATNAPLASDLYRVGPAGGTGKPPSQKEAAEELAHEAYRAGPSVLPPRGSGGPSPAGVSKMQPAETETATATKATQKGAEAKAKGPTPLEKEIHGPLAPFAEAPTFSVPPHAAPAATTATTAGGRPVGVAPVMGEMETMAPFPQPEPRLPMTFETTPPAGGLGLGAASSPLLGTSAAGLGETLGKTPETMEEEQEETVVPEKAGAGVGPSPTAGVSLLSPAKAAEAINKGIEQGEHALETVARRFLGSIREHVPSLVSVADSTNMGIEEVQGFVESVINKTAAGIRARLPSSAQSLESANVGVEQVGLVAERAERIAEATVEHATRAIRARIPSPAQGAEQINVQIEKAQDWFAHAEHIAEDVANRAVASVHEMLPSPAQGLAATNEGIAAGERMVKSATGSLFEKLPHHPTTTTTTGPATTTTTAASILSPAAILDRVNAGIEAATETVKGVLPVALGGTEMQQQGPAAGLSIKAPVEGVKSMMPSTPFPTPVAGGGEQAPSALSPAAIAESINEALEKGGEATQGPVKAVKETVSSTLGAVPTPPSPAQVAESVNRGIEQGGKAVAAATEKGKEAVGGVFAALPTLLPSPAAVAERINRAIDTTGTGASSGRGAPEQGWEGEAGAGGGGTAGFGEAYDQRAREAEARRMLEEAKAEARRMLEEAEAERTTPLAEGAAVTGAAPAGTRHHQPRMPQASLFGAVENVLESMHEAFARGVQMGGGGGGSREQPKPALSAEEAAAEQAMGTKAPVVIQEELTMETEGEAGEAQTLHMSTTIIK